MPLTAKGEEIKAALTKEYGEKKGEQVLYAGKNAGTFKGVDASRLDAVLNDANRLHARLDTWNESQHPRNADGEFSSGGSGGPSLHQKREAKSSYTSSSKLPFIRDLVQVHGTIDNIKKHLETVPDDKLSTAEKFINLHGDIVKNEDEREIAYAIKQERAKRERQKTPQKDPRSHLYHKIGKGGNEPVTMQEGSGWWKGEGGYKIPSRKDAVSMDTIVRDCARLDARLDALVEGKKTPREPYGEGNEYADPGYQEDKKKRYPLGSEEEIRAAWNYIHHGKDAAKYSPDHLKEIKSRIVRAWKEKIGKEGPPEAA